MNRLRRSLDAIDEFETGHPYAAAIGAGALRFAVGNAVTYLGDKAGVSLRHGRSLSPKRQNFYKKHPIISTVGMTIGAPIGEELLWRKGIASFAEHKFPDQPKAQLAIKLGSIAIFMMQHAGKGGIPVNQLMAGAIYQHVYEKNGLKASALAHATNNTLAVGQYALKNRRSRE